MLGMVDGVLLLVDAVEGPMPQTRFVTAQGARARAQGRSSWSTRSTARAPRRSWVVDQTFDLFDKLGATDEQLDFPVIYASALQGWATLDADAAERGRRRAPLFEAILEHVPAPKADRRRPAAAADLDARLQLDYVGRIGIGRIRRGTAARRPRNVAVLRTASSQIRRQRKVGPGAGVPRPERAPVEASRRRRHRRDHRHRRRERSATTVAADGARSGAARDRTSTSRRSRCTSSVNTSPLAGREGKYVTSRQIRERLARGLQSNVALRVEDTGDSRRLRVSGRGELHLTILIENMRREGYELARVAAAGICCATIDGVTSEPYEALTVDVEDAHQGARDGGARASAAPR